MIFVCCGKEEKESGNLQKKATSETVAEIMTYDEITKLPGRYEHADGYGFSSLQEHIDDWKARGVYKNAYPLVVRIKKVNYYCDLRNDGDAVNYLNPRGHSEYECEVVKIADGYGEGLKVGDIIKFRQEFYLIPEWDDLFDLIDRETGKRINKREELNEIENCTFMFEPEKGKNYKQVYTDFEFPLEEGKLYSCVYATHKDPFYCFYFYPVEDESSFLDLLERTYHVDDMYLGVSKEVNEMFK